MRRLIAVFFLTFVLSLIGAETNSFRFSNPVVCKIDWNTRSLLSEDLNGDGLKDLIVLNNGIGRINLFYQKKDFESEVPKQISIQKNRWEPVLENHPFYSSFVVTGSSMLSLAVGDVDSDGFMDLIYTGKDDPLTIRFQSSEGGFSETLVYNSSLKVLPRPDSIKVVDFDQDGRQDIMVATKDHLMKINVNKSRSFVGEKSYPWSSNPVYWQDFSDINQDGKLDLIYYTEGSPMSPVRVRYQQEDSILGSEVGLEISRQSTLALMPGEERILAGINRRSGSIEIHNIMNEEVVPGIDSLMNVASFPLSSKVSHRNACASGDLDNDGCLDVLIANPEKASIRFFRGDKKNVFIPDLNFPTLKEVDYLYVGDFQAKGVQQVLVQSSKENLIGLSQYDPDFGISFPELMKVDGDILCSSSIDSNLDRLSEMFWISKSGSNYKFVCRYWKVANQSWDEQTLELGKMSRKPVALYPFDINQDGKKDFIILIPREPARILIQESDYTFSEVLKDSPIRKSLLGNLLPEHLGRGDLNGDGKLELLIGSEGFVRAFFYEDGLKDLKVFGQFNAREGDSQLTIPFLSIDESGLPMLVAYDKKNKTFQFLKKELAGFKYHSEKKVDTLNPLGLVPANNESSFLLYTEDHLLVLNQSKKKLRLEKGGHYETNLKNVRHTHFLFGDFNNSKKTDILAYDGIQHALEVLERESKDYSKWSSLLHFNIFESNLHYKGPKGAQYEPRESICGDFNGDNKDDFAFLIHDRILVYFQE